MPRYNKQNMQITNVRKKKKKEKDRDKKVNERGIIRTYN